MRKVVLQEYSAILFHTSLRRWEKDLFLWKLSLVLQLTSVNSQLFQKGVEAYMLPEGIMELRENKLFLKEGNI